MTTPEPVTATTPRPVRRAVLVQQWIGVTFVHWAVEPAVVSPLLPPGTVPDVYAGATYVGLVAFRVAQVVPPFPGFAEVNVRLYTVDAAGRRGVAFRSLDASRLAPVLGARALGLPYHWATARAGGTRVESRRRWPGPPGAGCALDLVVGDALPYPSPLSEFLTARWGLHLRTGPRTTYWPTEHRAWTLHDARLQRLDEDLVAAAGLPAPERPPDSVLFSPGVTARFGPPGP
ncbi:MAG TPA: DUF2071 domain-containing protein [Mycobacteriales bacterium]|nr:DUF2071 domain-containing protein [Mycobacteriales bacterium]